MLTLRIRQEAGQATGQYRVQVELDEDGLVQAADVPVAFELDRQDARDLRWYLEDYLEYPVDPAPRIAARIEDRMAALGRDLFGVVFPPESETRDLWAVVRDRLSTTRVEIITDVAHATTIPWELLRDPRTDAPVALRARSFVRGYRQGAQRPRLPRIAPGGEESGAGEHGGEIRILLVICRPGGRDDVPFRSVAGQLVRMYPRVRQALRLKVLRPATFAALGRELRAAADRGEPYQIVHFDGHGTWADLSGGTLGGGSPGLSPLRYSARAGAHGYLLFEDPDEDDNVEYVDGVRLGSLLAETGVPLLVLNACRSAHADVAEDPAEAEAEGSDGAAAGARPAAIDDAHARVRAYGSLAQEIVDAGVAGVVAMRYNVYVVTATQFIAEMYENLLAGQELGQAVSRGRKTLADDPVREIAFERLSLQDWLVPVVYEVAPLRLFTPSAQPLTLGDPEQDGGRRDNLPPAPDTGFYGRDETLLALDRALDNNQIVLLHAFAGSGKTTTAVEFARWYQITGGLDDSDVGTGEIVFSSFELHRPLSSLLNDLWDRVSRRLPPGAADRWMGLSVGERRELALELLGRLPVLWIWDNVEPVHGFPAGSESAWSAAEIAELTGFLRDLRSTQAKVVLTSRRAEEELLGGLPTRIPLPPLTMPDRFQLARAVAERSGHRLTELADWRPLLRFSEGNPLTVTVLVREALRTGVRTREDVERFLSQIASGTGDIEDDEELGRSRSLGASLSYGLNAAFTEQERPLLAMLHLFQRAVEEQLLRLMVHALRAEGSARVQALVPGLTDDDVGLVLRKAAGIGLLTQVGEDLFFVHPALPWYFQRLFTEVFGSREDPVGKEVIGAYVEAITKAASFYGGFIFSGRESDVLPMTALHEANFLNARALAIAGQEWDNAGTIMQALQMIYERTARDSELVRLADELGPLLADESTGLPPPALEQDFLKITEIRVRAARRARKFEEAERLMRLSLKVSERRAEAARAVPEAERNLNALRSLCVDYGHLGLVLFDQGRPDCVDYFQKAMVVAEEIGDSSSIARIAGNLANVYLQIPGLRDLDEADKWLSLAIENYAGDPLGQSKCYGQRALLKIRQVMEGAGTDPAKNVEYMEQAADALNQAFRLLPKDATRELVGLHEYAGMFYQIVGATDEAVSHYVQAMKAAEETGQQDGIGMLRIKAAGTLAAAGRFSDAALFAEQAIRDAVRDGEQDEVRDAEELLAAIRAAESAESQA
jgi:tetratricopeptide (TPR) repeat protein